MEPPRPSPTLRVPYPFPLPGMVGLAIGFLVVHVLLDRLLRLRAGTLSSVPGALLVEIFIGWFPILLIAALLAFSTHRRLSTRARFAVLFGYAGTLILLVLVGGSVAAALFDLLLRLAPIAALVFLFGTGRFQWSLSRAIGLALMFTMLWRSLFFNFPDLLVIAAGGGVRPPTPAFNHYRDFFISTLWDVAYPILGLLFFFHRVPGVHAPAAWGRNLETVLRPWGAWIRRSVPLDVAWGGLFFVLNVVAIFLISQLLAGSSTSEVGDDSAVFREIQLDQVFLISIVAGVGEELVFRGLLQSGLTRMLSGRRGGVAVSILVTSVAFAIVHGGYQDLDHLIYPLLFGLYAGVVFHYFGIIPAILIHIEIDILALGLEYALAPTTSAVAANLMVAFLWFLLLANLAAGIVILAVHHLGRHEEAARRRKAG